MFEYLGDRLSNAIKNIKGMGRITEDNINDAVREIRMALLEADVNYEVAKEFTKNVKEKALGLEVGKSLKPEEVFIKLVKDELINWLSSYHLNEYNWGEFTETFILAEEESQTEYPIGCEMICAPWMTRIKAGFV